MELIKGSPDRSRAGRNRLLLAFGLPVFAGCVLLVILLTAPGPVIAEADSAPDKVSGPPPGAPTDQSPEAYQGLTEQEIRRLKAGEIVIMDRPEVVEGRQMISAAMIYKNDLDTVWTLMRQTWRQVEYLPRLERCTLIKLWEEGDIVEFQVKAMNVEIKYRILGTRDKSQYYSHWKLDPSFDNDMKEVSGYWRFYWINEDYTLGRYGTFVEPAIWIPRPVQDFLTKTDLPNALGAVRTWVNSGGTYRKPGYQPPPQ